MSDINPFKKAAEVASLEKLTDHQTLHLLTAFVLFVDLALVWWQDTNILKITYKWGEEIPVGAAAVILLAFGFTYVVVIHLMRIPFVYARIYAPDVFKRDERELETMGSREVVRYVDLRSYALENDNGVAAEVAREAAESERRLFMWRHRAFGLGIFALTELLLTPAGAINDLLGSLPPAPAIGARFTLAAAAIWLLFVGAEPASSLDDAIWWPKNPINQRRKAPPTERLLQTHSASPSGSDERPVESAADTPVRS